MAIARIAQDDAMTIIDLRDCPSFGPMRLGLAQTEINL
jgi:hypothetical protein